MRYTKYIIMTEVTSFYPPRSVAVPHLLGTGSFHKQAHLVFMWHWTNPVVALELTTLAAGWSCCCVICHSSGSVGVG